MESGRPARMPAIAALALQYRQGKAAPDQVVAQCLDRLRDPDAHGISICLTDQLASAQAAASRERFDQGTPRSLLDGIPVTWKDAIDVAGLPTTCGSRVTDKRPRQQDATVVARLHALGAVTVAKTNMSEFAFSGLGINPHFGTPVNPFSPPGMRHVCGGSSSGAAAAVARGACLVGIGTDTSGSIRVPAAYTGLVGYRPTAGRYPSAGVASLAPSMDTIGLIARSVADVVLVDRCLAPQIPRRQLDVSEFRFVVAENLFDAGVEPCIRLTCLNWVGRLKAKGLRCEMRQVPLFDEVRTAFMRHGTLVAAEAGHVLAEYAAHPMRDRLDPNVLQRLLAARGMLASDLVALQQIRQSLRTALGQEEPNSVYIFPTTPTPAPPLGGLLTQDRFQFANSLALRHTMIGSFLDMPGIAIPCGFVRHGLPTSVLLSMPSNCDDALLALASYLESVDL